MVRLERIGLVCAMAVVTCNIWTGGPLLALWIGSRVQGPGPPDMGAIAAAGVSLGVISYVLVRLLARLDAIYGRVTGTYSSVSRHVPWLRSMRGERPHQQRHVRELSPLEVVLVVSVVIAVALFEVWFFFYSSSPIDQRSGRAHDAPLIGDQPSEISATPAATSPAPARRLRPNGSRPLSTSAAAAMTTLDSRTAATVAAGASLSAASVSA